LASEVLKVSATTYLVSGDIMRFRSLAALAFGFVSLTVACAASPEEEGTEDSEGALSHGVCIERAKKAKDEAYNKCANGAFDYTACTKPARDAMEAAATAYNAEFTAAQERAAAANAVWAKVASDCVAALPTDCAELLASDAYEAAKFKNGRGNQAVCNAERKAQTAECNRRALEDANDDAATNAKNDPKLKAASSEWWSKWRALIGSRVSCGTQKAVDATHDSVICGSEANAAHDNAYGTCRRECPAETLAVCTPKEYQDKGIKVECGAMKKQQAFWTGRCEDNLKCERTKVCDQYDETMEALKDGKVPACPPEKMRKFEVRTERRGNYQVAKSLSLDCVDAPKN